MPAPVHRRAAARFNSRVRPGAPPTQRSMFMSQFPMSDAATPAELAKVRALVARKNWIGAANTTKWNELITYFRGKQGWTPDHRSKWVNGYVSEWGGDWHYHLPLPFLGVEWLDITVEHKINVGMLVSPQVVNHSGEIIEVLKKIGPSLFRVGNRRYRPAGIPA